MCVDWVEIFKKKTAVSRLLEWMKTSKEVKKTHEDMRTLKHKKYYSQRGEDILIYNFFKYFYQNTNIHYIDIGCYDPYISNNTYLLYCDGSYGICVDANASMCYKFKSERSLDIVLNYAITDKHKEKITFYMFKNEQVSTTCSNYLEYLKRYDGDYVKTDVPAMNINRLLDMAYQEWDTVELLCLDIEGTEFDVIKEIDFSKYRPIMICVEVVDYNTGLISDDGYRIEEFLKINGYILYSTTYVNHIFVDKSIFQHLKEKIIEEECTQ